MQTFLRKTFRRRACLRLIENAILGRSIRRRYRSLRRALERGLGSEKCRIKEDKTSGRRFFTPALGGASCEGKKKKRFTRRGYYVQSSARHTSSGKGIE